MPYSKIGNGELTKDTAKENNITVVWFKDDNTPVPMIADYLENGISSRTGHFSEYAVVGDPSVKKKDDAPSGNNGSISGTGNTGGISVPVIAPPVDNIETVKTEAATKIEDTIKAVDTKSYTEEEKKAIEDIKAAAEKAIR